MLSRPKPNETEEDLLRLQQEFLKQPSETSKPAVGVTKRKSDYGGSETATERISETASDMESCRMDIGDLASSSNKKRVKFKPTVASNNSDQISSLTGVEDGPPVETLLLDIIERDTTRVEAQPPTLPKGRPFPTIYRRDPKVLAAESKKSIFAQQIMRLGRETLTTAVGYDTWPAEQQCSRANWTVKEAKMDSKLISYLGETSCIVDGTGLLESSEKEEVVKEIHKENIERLSKMSQEEILMEQQQLIETISPDLLRFLKSKRKKPESDEFEPKTDRSKMDETERSQHSKQKSSVSVPEIERKVEETEEMPSAEGSNSNPNGESGIDELPISVTEAKQWLHMDKLEPEKLAWMTSLPQPRTIDPKTGYQARFDFDGFLINRDSDVPVHQGLHHHGEEPEVPGYTLEELFIYARSVVIQQRVLGLITLTKVLLKCKEGLYDSCLSEPILPQVLNAGIVPMLRWALDDNTEGCLSAVIAALHTLIVSMPDEISLDHTFLWHRGEESPFVQPDDKDVDEEKKTDMDEGEDDLKDADLVKLDVIKGLIRMDLLPRLRYILEVCRPSSVVVVQILEILTRIARHSLDSSYAIMRCPRLLPTVINEFTPQTWSTLAKDSVMKRKIVSAHGTPLPQAVRLVRVLASAGQHLAEDLVHRYKIMDSLLCYASMDPTEGPLPSAEAMKLCISSYHTWTAFLHYGLTLQSYWDFYPIIMRQLQFYQTLSLDVHGNQNPFNFDHAAALLKFLSAAVRAMTTNQQATSQADWCQIENLFMAAELCLKKWLWELTRFDIITHSAWRLVGTTLGFISTVCERSSSQATCNPLKILNSTDEIYTRYLTPLMRSQVFENQLLQLSRNSSLMCNKQSGRKRDPITLPSLGSLLWDGHLNPVLETESPFCFLTQLTRCLHTFHDLHKHLSNTASGEFLDHPVLQAYLRSFVSIPNDADTTHWLSRFETHFLHYLLMLCGLIKCNTMQVYHEVAVQLLPRLQQGDEDVARQIMTTVIFNLDFMSEGELHTAMEELKLQEASSIGTMSMEEAERSNLKMLHYTCHCLRPISDIYHYYLGKHLSISQPKRWKEQGSLCIPQPFKQLVPYDFPYLPLTVLYRLSNDVATASRDTETEDSHRPDILRGTLHCLQWCHFLSLRRKNLITKFSPGLRFSKLSLVFLISSDLFLNAEIRGYLEGCLRDMVARGELCHLDLEENPKVGLPTFHDLYKQLLTQYESTSYGDHLYGMFILVPMQQQYSVFLRRALWTEHLLVARILGVGLKELLVPLENFLIPFEDDKELLFCYFKAVINGSIRQKWCPVLYIIAVHHLHHFLFMSSPGHKLESMRRQMLNKLSQEHKHQDFAKHLLGYQGVDTSSDLGFTFTENPFNAVLDAISHLI